jgi:hypothetical protein
MIGIASGIPTQETPLFSRIPIHESRLRADSQGCQVKNFIGIEEAVVRVQSGYTTHPIDRGLVLRMTADDLHES